ncbi:MAG: hypothetical protein ACR2OI_10645, partial [Acidimicrobiia bacterium]
MDAPASALHSAFVGSFSPYLKEILEQRGLPAISADIVRAAEQWLDAQLAALLELPYARQRRSPLEVVQEAMTGPTKALQEAGAKPVLRDPVSVAALPGDIFGIAPASSSVLGEEAFQAHLAWGVEKARALAPQVVGGLSVLVVSGDLMDRSKFEDAVNGAGLEMVVWGRGNAEVRPAIAFVDPTHSDADEAITTLSGQGVRVVAFGPHVDEDAMVRA